jgi:hypothetical protein
VLYFFDTSGLQYRYFSGKHSRGVRRIISDVRNECYISELTVLEVQSTIGKRCRGANLPLTEFARLEKSFWRDVHERRLLIRPVQKQALMRARSLLRLATELNRKMTSADSVVASSAMELAFERGQKVTLCLEDWGLYDVTRGIRSYQSVLRFKYLGEDKSMKGTKAKSPPCPQCGK